MLQKKVLESRSMSLVICKHDKKMYELNLVENYVKPTT